MQYPIYRPRRMRRTETLRRMMRETRLSVDNLINPLFVVRGKGVRKEITTMPGVCQFSVDEVVKECREIFSLGIPSVILFGIPDTKDDQASEAYDSHGVVQEAVTAIKNAVPDLVIITDVCLCEYTSHGHCGIVENGQILNDPTLELLAMTAVSHARAGADVVGPSDMMDGRVAAIRDALDDEGFSDTIIMSYAVKYASSFYGPFREAAESAPQFGDRRAYQMDPPNAQEALREAGLDIEEGADIIMVKPALPYLDIISNVRERFDMPLAAYNVSGEYSMVKAGARLGWIDGEKVMMESLISIKRAGASMILTYFAKEAARLLV
ncbi:MAG TPA: porphobilinogen synthase [Proteobacteria bacterium]|nr:delta-aminolevulinic acid dehydratase [bacterium BMS3Abin14]HDL53686.1 porphobilinogen synthase [Pseudomonadota bacterium]